MSYFDSIMSATQAQGVKRHVSKTAKALARHAFDTVDVSELLAFDDATHEIFDMRETHARHAIYRDL